MSDDVDDLLRRAMATLDRQVPSGYFDALPERTLARLEDPASRRTRGRRRTAAIVGVGLAAAAGVVVFLTVRDRNRADTARPDAVATIAAERPAAAPARAPAPPTDPGTGLNDLPERRAEAPSAAAMPSAVAAPDVPRKLAVSKTKRPDGKRSPSKVAALPDPQVRSKLAGQGAFSGNASPTAPRPGGAKPASGGAGSGADQAPLDERLDRGEQAGAQVKQPVKPRSGPASLSADDIQRGMTAVAARVQACYAGTRGVATLQVTVAPSGQVAKVAVTGPFAGTPVGACVERSAASAKFPPRDGAPQTFGYSYLLSD